MDEPLIHLNGKSIVFNRELANESHIEVEGLSMLGHAPQRHRIVNYLIDAKDMIEHDEILPRSYSERLALEQEIEKNILGLIVLDHNKTLSELSHMDALHSWFGYYFRIKRTWDEYLVGKPADKDRITRCYVTRKQSKEQLEEETVAYLNAEAERRNRNKLISEFEIDKSIGVPEDTLDLNEEVDKVELIEDDEFDDFDFGDDDEGCDGFDFGGAPEVKDDKNNNDKLTLF